MRRAIPIVYSSFGESFNKILMDWSYLVDPRFYNERRCVFFCRIDTMKLLYGTIRILGKRFYFSKKCLRIGDLVVDPFSFCRTQENISSFTKRLEHLVYYGAMKSGILSNFSNSSRPCFEKGKIYFDFVCRKTKSEEYPFIFFHVYFLDYILLYPENLYRKAQIDLRT